MAHSKVMLNGWYSDKLQKQFYPVPWAHAFISERVAELAEALTPLSGMEMDDFASSEPGWQDYGPRMKRRLFALGDGVG
ncbi:hypothetical protein O9992_22165 [Vibrio lentus]|nr:hypothetical protein [Vibrio lentus]